MWSSPTAYAEKVDRKVLARPGGLIFECVIFYGKPTFFIFFVAGGGGGGGGGCYFFFYLVVVDVLFIV